MRKPRTNKIRVGRLTFNAPSDGASWDFKMGFRYAMLQVAKKLKAKNNCG